MKKINIIGNIFGSSGYAVHTRSLANALYEQGLEVRIECQKPNQYERQVNDAELLMLTREYSEDMINIMIGQPPFWRTVTSTQAKGFIGFLVWEGDKIPEYWIEYLVDERVNQIWVPSQHVKDAIYNSFTYIGNHYWDGDKLMNKDGFVCEIKVIPHGVDLSIFNSKEDKEKEERAHVIKSFTFCCNKGWRGGNEDRGGVQYLLKAYLEEFTKEDNVRLILKLNPEYLPLGFDFKTEIEKLGFEKLEDSPEILVNTSNIVFSEMVNLYNQSDVFVCPTRCEGFNIPGIEAQACGLPTIQTNFGGQIDYMTDKTDWFINYELVDVTHDIMYEGVKWATPDIEHLKQIMRYVYENQDLVKKAGEKAVKNASKWTWRSTAQKAIKALKEL